MITNRWDTSQLQNAYDGGSCIHPDKYSDRRQQQPGIYDASHDNINRGIIMTIAKNIETKRTWMNAKYLAENCRKDYQNCCNVNIIF